ncbi:enoyl-ACP reductase FabV [Anaeromicropila populeti]|uniref:Trans-2-enoyl-CoA reductase [NADH] n=1 Tax=Anaeromicropila populeti TaxID=37658 RepID=A0A1I6JY26_9FIRM|nr:enoyl-ACP reductase FabV [Anaeromicropila populeti]SFR83895.1 enoyl-[acyl-carrier protein] reductase / trans-2-enoyl-CoA reductase (NAD+) [Anaeromicropila populeti]
MIIEPKVKGFICTTAHPLGCAENVSRQIQYVKEHSKIAGPKNVLVIGCSTGYGLSSRITAAFGCQASTLGIMFEKPATEKRTATPGWYNTAALESMASAEGLYARTINNDAFAPNVKQEAIDIIRKDLGQVDMVIYSIAAPRRTAPDGVTYHSTLKTTSESYTNKSWNLVDDTIYQVTINPASEEEVLATQKVMGGEDWKDWITALSSAGVLAPGALTIAYSYIGPEVTHPIYFNGTIGMAKRHLHKTAEEITKEFQETGIQAYVSVNKALVTQASSAIPIVPLYIALLYKVMKAKGLHEGCIEQMQRMFQEKIFGNDGIILDNNRLIRMDDYEMSLDVQEEVKRNWDIVCSDNLKELGDTTGYWDDFYNMFGFYLENIDYSQDVPMM